MPYNAVTKDGIELNNIPDHITPDSPELKQIVAQERGRRKYEQIDKDSQITPEQAGARAAEGMGTGQRALANIGAGITNAWEGFKQVMPGVKSSSNEDLKQKRVLDKALAKSSETGIGADWMPSAGSALQFAGEVAPSLAIPAGAMTGVGAKMLPRALQALVSTPTRAAMTGGAVAGALMPTVDDESRVMNTALGGAGGAVLPLAAKAYRYAKPRFSKQGRADINEARAGEELMNKIGEPEAAHAANMIENVPLTGAARDIPMTTAQRVRVAEGAAPTEASTRLAATELGTRGAMADEFGQLTRQQAAGVNTAADKAFGDRNLTGQLKDIRDAATGPQREAALKSASRWSEVGRPLNKEVDALMASSVPGSPQRGLATLAKKMLDENPTPEQLYLFRKLLAKKLDGPHMPGDDIAAIVKGADRETLGLMKAIDARLNQGAKSKTLGDKPWTDYLDTYVAESKPVTSARAQDDIYKAITPEGGRLVGESPQITRHTLDKAMQKFGKGRFGDKLDPAAQGRADDLLTTLQRMEEPMNTVKLGGTGGGGSQTTMQRALVERGGSVLETASGIPMLGTAARFMMQTADAALKRDLAGLMLDPTRAARAIRLKLAQNQPLTRVETELLAALGKSAGASTGSLMQQE